MTTEDEDSDHETTEDDDKDDVTTEEDSTDEDHVETTTEVRNKTIVYKKKEFRDLCKDPVFDAIDSSIDGTEIIVFKGDKFFVMESTTQTHHTLS